MQNQTEIKTYANWRVNTIIQSTPTKTIASTHYTISLQIGEKWLTIPVNYTTKNYAEVVAKEFARMPDIQEIYKNYILHS